MVEIFVIIRGQVITLLKKFDSAVRIQDLIFYVCRQTKLKDYLIADILRDEFVICLSTMEMRNRMTGSSQK